MKLLLDECVPRKLKAHFQAAGFDVLTVREAGFAGKENGELLAAAEGIFDVLVTIDRNIRHQQNMTGRRLSILVLVGKSNDIDDLLPCLAAALLALAAIRSGTIIDVS